MADAKSRRASLLLTMLLVALNLGALNWLIAGWSTARVDLTEGNAFSISRTTKRILTSLEEDVTITGYFSKRTHPKLAPLVPQIRDMLEEYRAISRGRVRIEWIDPGEDEAAAEEAANRYGVQSTPFSMASKFETGIVNAWFALVVRYADQYERYTHAELIDVQRLPDGDFEVTLRNLEYDLTRAIKKVVYNVRTTAELFQNLETPAKLTAIFTPESLPEIFADVPEAVRSAAQELAEVGRDRFVFEELDPAADEAADQRVRQLYGLPPLQLGLLGGESFYLYGLLEIGDRIEQLDLASESVTAASLREAIEAALRRNTPGSLKRLGVVKPGEPEIPPEVRRQLQMPPQPPPEFQELERLLGEEYEVTDVRLEDGVPADVDTLIVMKPKNLEAQQLYALDQYLMRGGRVAICAGNYDVDFGPTGLALRPIETGIEEWLAHHGLTTEKTLLLDERNRRLPIPEVRSTPFGQLRTFRFEPYPYLVDVTEDGIVDRNVAATVEGVGIYWGSPLLVDEQAAGELEVLPILRSSERSWTSDDLGSVAYVDYTIPEEGLEPHLLAAALKGRFASYFADKPIPGTGEDAGEDAAAPTTFTLSRSPETRLVVIGNAEFLSDFVARALGPEFGGLFFENLTFMKNLIDWLNLDDDMVSIRARGAAARRLPETSDGTKVVYEAVNYLIPAVLLIAVGAYLFWMRRNAVPLSARAGAPGGSPATGAEP